MFHGPGFFLNRFMKTFMWALFLGVSNTGVNGTYLRRNQVAARHRVQQRRATEFVWLVPHPPGYYRAAVRYAKLTNTKKPQTDTHLRLQLFSDLLISAIKRTTKQYWISARKYTG